MTTKIVKSTSRGQITLPKAWRMQSAGDNYLLEMKKGQLVIKPVILKNEPEVIIEEYEDGFDMTFPNGIPAEDLIEILENIED